MKKLSISCLKTICVSAFIFLIALDGHALRNLGELEIAAGYWFASGDLSWETSFSDYIDGLSYDGKSRLEWDADSDYLTLETKYMKDNFFGKVRYGTADIKPGTTWDTDWIVIPGLDYTNDPWLRSFNPSDGENYFYGLDVGFYRKSGQRGSTSIFLGYFKKNQELAMHDPLTYDIADWQSTYQVFEDGLASTYDIDLKGFRIGLETEVRRSKKLTLKGLIAYYPKLDADGTGYWNLRDLTFYQSGDGSGTEIVTSLLYNFNDIWSLEFGYRDQQLEADDGTSEMFFSDGTTAQTTWETANSDQSGFFLALRASFN